MPSETSRELIEVIKKIPLFSGLPPTQIRKVLAICTSESHQPEDKICIGGLPSTEMYILISGELAVVTPDGLRVATIVPVTTVGEMGVITGHPRSATVEVTKPSRLLLIQKAQFDFIMRSERDIRTKVYQNIIEILSEKLVKDNVRMRDHVAEKNKYEARIKVQDQKFGIALDLLEEKGLAREEAESQIAVKLKEIPPLILVVDDEEDMRRLVRASLPSYAVLEAGNGKEALEVLEEEQANLVITDIKMPEMDGYALLTKVRELYPELPVLAISGYVDSEEIQEYDFNGFVEKPVKMEDFKKLIEATLAGGE